MRIRPYKLDLSQFGEKVRDQMKFMIVNVSDKPVDLSMVCLPNELATVTLPKSIAAGQTAEGTIKLTKAALTKEFEEIFTFELSDEAHTRFSVPIKRALRIPGQPGEPAAPTANQATPQTGSH